MRQQRPDSGRQENQPKPFGLTRVLALPAGDVRHASAVATMYAVEPYSTATVRLDASGLRPGDAAGLVLFNGVFAWLGVERAGPRLDLVRFDEQSGQAMRMPLGGFRVWLRAECDFVRHEVGFRFSADGQTVSTIGEPLAIGGPPGATRSIGCSLFACGSRSGAGGGHADFDSFVLATDWTARPTARR